MGIFSSKTDLEKDADCIVTAVFLGLALESGKGLKIAIEPGDKGKDPDVDLKDALLKVNGALKALNPKHTDVQGVVAPPWKEEGSWITGGLHTELDPKTLAPFIPVNKDPKNNALKQYTGPGAYTGVVVYDKKLAFWGSTFEYQVQGKRKFGKSLGATIENMHREKNGAGINGYVHGMIQACYVAAQHNSTSKAKVVEIAVGKETLKMASCFGCTTFMLAVGRQPSHIHLGRANSWAPADEKNQFCVDQLLHKDRINLSALGTDKAELVKDIPRLNSQWRNRIAVWAHKGAQLPLDRIDKDHQESWKQVQTVLGKQQLEGAADYFLDALGADHTQDAKRIRRTLIGGTSADAAADAAKKK